MNSLIKDAARILAESRHAIALTGAGVSTASGLPDFRGPKGLWRRIPEEYFHISHFKMAPDEAWMAIVELFKSGISSKPNRAHKALAVLEMEGVIRAVITQNVDGLHQMAGSKKVIELHGSGKTASCMSCGYKMYMEEAVRLYESMGKAPKCPKCGGIMKPDVIFFGEPLPLRALLEAQSLASKSDAILIAGSSLFVSPANKIPIIVKENGGKVIIVNEEPTMMDHIADAFIKGRVEEIIPLLCRETLALLGRIREC